MRIKILLIVVLFSVGLSAQTNKEVEEALSTTDIKTMANFVVKYPKHPNTKSIIEKMNASFQKQNYKEQKNTDTPKPKIEKLDVQKVEQSINKDIKDGTNDSHKKTAELLSALLNGSKDPKKSVIIIKNRAECNLVVAIKGNKFYNMDVQSNSENYLIVDKGVYQFTSNVCDAQYNAIKNIQDDTIIVLSKRSK